MSGPLSAKKGVDGPSEPERWRVWGFRLTAALVIPALLLILIEAGLRVCGYGYPTSFYLRTEDGRSFTTNRKFCWQFYDREIATEPHPLLMAARKPPGTLRIFILGESAAEGTPNPSFGFARILEVMLARAYPQTRFEVVNAAVRGINSHIILPIARECLEHEPDLFILYMGNNEVEGLYAPVPGRFNLTPYLKVLRFRQWLKSTRLAQVLDSLVRRWEAKVKLHDMNYFRQRRLAFDDPQRQAVYENFRENLNDICDFIQKSGAKTVLATTAVNLRDCPPLGSLHRAPFLDSDGALWDKSYAAGIAAESDMHFESAVGAYKEAAEIDGQFAEVQFRLARSLLASGQTNQARDHYILARDWDAIQFRSDGRINDIIRRTASSRAGGRLQFLDAVRVFASSPMSVAESPGAELFRDDVHFTFEGDYLLAGAALPEVASSLGLGPMSNSVPTRAECADILAFTTWDEYTVLEAMVDLGAEPPFLDQIDHERRELDARRLLALSRQALTSEVLRKCGDTYMKAVKERPDDWQLRLNAGAFLAATWHLAEAVRELRAVVAVFPREPYFRVMLANVLASDGRFEEANHEIEEAARIDPDYPSLAEARRMVSLMKSGGGRLSRP
jgi:tetratricopeptide (TPR) repeat protein